MLNAGQLRYPITIQVETQTPDSFGQPQSTWSTVLQTRADIRVASSRDVYALGSGFTEQVTHKIVMRYPAVTIASGMQVLYRGQTYRIQTAQDPDQQRVEMDLMVLAQDK